MKLAKELGLVHIFAIASGAMISSGLFILPGLAHARAGPAVVLSYFLAGVLALGGLLSIIELTTAMPKAGADYFYISRAMGPAAGTAAGILSWFSLSLKGAFALVGLSVLAESFLPGSRYFVATGGALVFVAINLVGAKEAARFQVVLVAALLALMGYFVLRGAPRIQARHFEPFAPGGWQAIVSTAGFVFVSYGGLVNVASIAGEVKRPGRLIPLGMLLALAVVVALYTLMVLVTGGVLGAEQLDHSLTPISDAAATFLGPVGRTGIQVAAALAFLTTANAGILTASRYLFAASEDRLLPPVLGQLSGRFNTPYVAILATGALVMVALFVRLDLLVEVASTVFALAYILASVCVILLRESGLQNYRPSFCTPLYPWVQIVTVIGFAFLVFEMGERAFLVTAALIAASFAVYWFYGRHRTQRESAALLLLRRIATRDFPEGSLDEELKAIVRERDETALDRFDQIIENSLVLDFDRGLSLDELFGRVAEKMAPRVGIEPGTLADLLRAREKDSSTVLSPMLAVPHVVIDQSEHFEILLARCRAGIRFSDRAPDIRMVFVVVGGRPQRNFYLRVLAAIAQIVQDPDFEAKWMAARNEQAMRDTILLSRRTRPVL